MKRLWIGIGVLAVMLAAGIWLTLLFARIHAPMSRDMEQASDAALSGDWEKATALAENARADWEQYRSLIAASADHEPLEQMEYLLDQLRVYARVQNAAHFSALCVRIARLADAMLDSQQISWWSILSDACPGRTAPRYRGRSGSQ